MPPDSGSDASPQVFGAALRRSVDDVANAVAKYAKGALGRATVQKRATFAEVRGSELARVFSPGDTDWTVVAWAGPLAGDAERDAALSKSLRTPVSTLEIRPGRSWGHILHAKGQQVDAFSSSREDALAGDSRAVAKALRAKPDPLGRYFVQVPPGSNEKAHPDDRFALGDVDLVGLDFWARLGIRFPTDPDDWQRRVLG